MPMGVGAGLGRDPPAVVAAGLELLLVIRARLTQAAVAKVVRVHTCSHMQALFVFFCMLYPNPALADP